MAQCLSVSSSTASPRCPFRSSSGALPIHGLSSQTASDWTDRSGKEKEVDNKSLKCSESTVDDWSWCRDALWILYSLWWSTNTLKSMKTVPQHRASWFGLSMEKKRRQKKQQQQSLQSSQCAWWREPTDCGSTRTLLCLLVILVPCIFWQVQGWFYFRTSPHVQALVTKVSFLLSANTRTFSYSDDIRLWKNIAKNKKQNKNLSQ